jgi:hypothetical protein
LLYRFARLTEDRQALARSASGDSRPVRVARHASADDAAAIG